MQSEPDRRYQSTQEMQADMEAARVPMPAPPAQSSPAPEGTRSIPHAAGQVFPPATPTPTKSKAPLYAGSVLVVMALAGAFVFGRPKAKTPALPTPAPAPIADTSLAKAQPPQKSGGPNATFGAVTKDAPFVNTLGMKFVPVPGTRIFFSIWDTRVRDYAAYGAANPNVDGMWKTGKKDGVPVGQEPDHPVINVNWEDAQAFCQWLTEKEVAAGKLPEGARYRLPTDEEWSRAARLPREDGSTPDERNRKNVPGYPWGQDWPPTRKAGNYADDTFHARFQTSPNDLKQWMQGYDDGFLTTSPVGSFPANEHGLYDMGGNVWQWCEDQWNTQQTNRGVRGASWSDGDHDIVRLSSRKMIGPTTRDLYYGFRCVLEDHPKPGPGGPRPPPERRPDGQRPPPPGNGPPREGPPGEGAPPVRQ
jgi:formylglycine-generating enzyme required for sulfatase activity